MPDEPLWYDWRNTSSYFRIVPRGGDPLWFNPNTSTDPADPLDGRRFHHVATKDVQDYPASFQRRRIVRRYGRITQYLASSAPTQTDPKLKAEAAADPNIGVLRGAFAVTRDGEMVGVVAVSGASLGGAIGLDEDAPRLP